MKIRVFAILGMLGCSKAAVATPPKSDPHPLAELLTAMSARCTDGARASSQDQSNRDQLFVEAAILEVSNAVAAETSLADLRSLPETARLVAAPHVLATFERRAEMNRGSVEPAEPAPALVRWSVLPRRAGDTTVLDVELELAPWSKSAAAGSRQTVTFSTTVRENAPVLARVEWDAASQRSLLILFRTFEVHGDRELRAIFECKMQQRAAALRRASAGSAP